MQAALNAAGGARETHAPVAVVVIDVNIASLYAKDGTHLGDLGWRPHERQYDATSGLFVCG